jgi:hypothetical protein
MDETSKLVHLADACNADRRFVEKHWVVSAETIVGLMTTTAFKDSLKNLDRGVPQLENEQVAALFRARESEVREEKKRLSQG